MRLIFSILLFLFTTNLAAEETKKAVLITGASSGLGARMMEVLRTNGFYVYATALDETDLPRMNALENVSAFKLDVRSDEDVAALAAAIKKQDRGLYGLMNNAGVAIFGPMAEVSVQELEYQMAVNVVGPYRVMQVFLPMLMESKGRIATTGSIAGTVTSPLFAHYSMSKHAIDAFTDGLAAELEGTGIDVGVIEPGSYASQIGATAKKRILELNTWPEKTAYVEQRKATLERLGMVAKGADPQPVADAVLDFFKSEKPQRRYMVVPNEAQGQATLRTSMRELIQRNDTQQYSYDDAKLVEMFREEMKAHSGTSEGE